MITIWMIVSLTIMAASSIFGVQGKTYLCWAGIVLSLIPLLLAFSLVKAIFIWLGSLSLIYTAVVMLAGLKKTA